MSKASELLKKIGYDKLSHNEEWIADRVYALAKAEPPEIYSLPLLGRDESKLVEKIGQARHEFYLKHGELPNIVKMNLYTQFELYEVLVLKGIHPKILSDEERRELLKNMRMFDMPLEPADLPDYDFRLEKR